jgi:hypothetical protein
MRLFINIKVASELVLCKMELDLSDYEFYEDINDGVP